MTRNLPTGFTLTSNDGAISLLLWIPHKFRHWAFAGPLCQLYRLSTTDSSGIWCVGMTMGDDEVVKGNTLSTTAGARSLRSAKTDN